MQTASVTNLTTALEGVQDASDPKEFNGDLIKKLHVAEKHIRKNKLKARPPPCALEALAQQAE